MFVTDTKRAEIEGQLKKIVKENKIPVYAFSWKEKDLVLFSSIEGKESVLLPDYVIQGYSSEQVKSYLLDEFYCY